MKTIEKTKAGSKKAIGAKPKVKVKRKKPTMRQLLAFRKAVENGGNITQAMRDVKYSETTINNPANLTESDGWKLLEEKFMSDEQILSEFNNLIHAKRTDYFVFSKRMDDEEIISHVNAVGIQVITIRESEKGKMAFYYADDMVAKKSAIDMAFKVKGKYKDTDKGTPTNNTFNFTNVYNQAQEMKAREKNKDIVVDPVEVENSPEKILQEMKKKVGL